MSGVVLPTEAWDVFISFASPDRNRAEDLSDQLERGGWRAFLDQDSINPGDRALARLQEGVRGSRVVAVLLSEHSDAAHYQREEILLAIELEREEKLKVVPVYLDGQPTEPAAWEFGLRNYERIDWSKRGVEGTAEQLIGVLIDTEGRREATLDHQTRSVGEILHGAALRIDRAQQWEPLRRICIEEKNALFLLHGPKRQNLDLFVSRIWHYLGPECGVHYHPVVVPLRVGFAKPRSAAAWENHLRYGLAGEGSGAGTAEDFLREAARQHPVFLVLSRLPIARHGGDAGGLDEVEIEALADFLGDRLPELLHRAAKGRHAIHALLATHYDREKDSLVDQLRVAASKGCKRRGVRYRELAALEPLKWKDVADFLNDLPNRPPDHVYRDVKAAFDSLQRDDLEFRKLLELLARLLFS